MKRVVLTGIGVTILACFCVMLFLRLERDDKSHIDISTKNADTEVADVNSLKKPNVPEGWSEEEWEKEFDTEMAKEAALEEAQMEKLLSENIDSILTKWRLDRSDADLAEIDSMLSKFESLESMSESAIIDTLLSFYPEKLPIEGQRQNLIGYYRDLDGLETITKDQKLQFLLYFTQEIVSNNRKIEREVAEAS